MKIQRFEIVGLFGREGTVSGTCDDDLNILTGRNGAGKTSILKVLWYIISGNIHRAVDEVSFKRASIRTDQYSCTVHRISRSTCKIELTVDGEKTIYEDYFDEENNSFTSAEDDVNPILTSVGSSIFLPTFRRLEGGFTLTRGVPLRPRNPNAPKARSDIEDALASLSRRLTNEPHTFVSSISTVDIVGIILQKYADLSEISNDLQRQTSQEIVEQIRTYKNDKSEIRVPNEGEEIEGANSLIDSIKNKIEVMEAERINIMTPIEAVKGLVKKLFSQSGIDIGSRFSFGDAANAVNSDALSAGEKQMLSFICYNAFYTDSVFFIDEPELSLHVDWQRQLFPILLAQQSSNQFFIATHSPFIYSKYPDKELIVDQDRGE